LGEGREEKDQEERCVCMVVRGIINRQRDGKKEANKRKTTTKTKRKIRSNSGGKVKLKCNRTGQGKRRKTGPNPSNRDPIRRATTGRELQLQEKGGLPDWGSLTVPVKRGEGSVSNNCDERKLS